MVLCAFDGSCVAFYTETRLKRLVKECKNFILSSFRLKPYHEKLPSKEDSNRLKT